jgi:hypothetical protein
VTNTSVTVWVALKQHATVNLEILQESGASFSPPMKASLQTVAVGTNLHIVAVTARNGSLVEGAIYLYDVSFDVSGTHFDLTTGAKATSPTSFAYAPYSRPSFSLPPSDLTKLRVMHGSCRKPNADGTDALSFLDTLIAENPNKANDRPHQLLLTGDQIYADEVAETLLLMLTDAGDTLLAWPKAESLPGVGKLAAKPAAQMPPGTRTSRIKQAGFTSDDTRCHLMSLGEYLAMYLFVWSDVLWPTTQPTYDDLINTLQANVDALRETTSLSDVKKWTTPNRTNVDSFRKTLPAVRRALANIPTYMICDDHEITDDWNLTRDFCDGVYATALGVRVIQNGLVAFALCQAWGNTPMQFDSTITPTPAGAKLLTLLSAYEANSSAIQKLIGIHAPAALAAHKPTYAVFHDEGALIQNEGYTFTDASLYFHYTVEGPSHQIIVTDTRTWRAFPGGGGDHGDLLPLDVLQRQIGRAPALKGRQLMVVITTNLPPIGPIRFASTVSQTVTDENDFYDSWELPALPSDHFVVALSNAIKSASGGAITGNVVLLSGDVHHSFASRMSYHANYRVDDPLNTGQNVQMVFAQLVSSALHNQSEKTLVLHREGYQSSGGHVGAWMIPKHVPEGYAGWNPSQLSSVPFIIGTKLMTTGYSELLSVTSSNVSFRLVRPGDNVRYGLTGADPILVNLTQAPHFRYRLDYLEIDNTGVQPLSPVQLGAIPELDKQKASMDAYRKYDKFKSGRQIVGANNIAELTFQGDAHNPTVAHHTVRWAESDDIAVNGVVWARYAVSLDPKDGNYIDIKAVKEP